MQTVKQIWNGDCLLSCKSSNSRGVAILLKRNFEYKILSSYSDQSGNYIVANLEISEVNIKLVNIYGPNSDSPSFFKKIHGILVSNKQEYIIICGEFNTALNTTLEKKTITTNDGHS